MSLTSGLMAFLMLAQGNGGSVTGHVRAAGSGAPLSDVIVRIDGTRFGTYTDAAGRYTLAGVPSGTFVLIAQRVGLKEGRETLVIGADSGVTVDFALAPAATVLAPMVVSASREEQRRTEASATIDVLSAAELRRARPAHPNEIMNRLPGVHVIELSGEGHMTAIRQPITTKPVYLYLEDGVPTRATGFFNHNALYEVNVPQSGGIEVLKGPGTALYGSDAIGGVINVMTRPAPIASTLEATAEGGVYGWGRLLLSAGGTRGGNGVLASVNLTRTDGWRESSGYDRQSATLRWDRRGARGWKAKTVVTGSNIDQNDVFTLNQGQFDTRSTLNRSPITFRRVQAVRVTSAIEKDAGATLWSVTPYARYDVLDLMPYWQLSFDPQLWATRNTSAGLLFKVRQDFVPLKGRLIAGADADFSPGHFDATQVVWDTTGADHVYSSYTLGAKQYDYDVTYRALSPYVQLELSPVPRLRVDAGLRYDLPSYVYDTKLPPLDTAGERHKRPADTTVSYHHLSPKLGITLDVTPQVNLFASYRHGFRAPSQQQLFAQGSATNTVGLKPVKVDSYEAGVRGGVGGRFLYTVSAYDMRLTDDILTFVNTTTQARTAVNAGESRYRGIEAGIGWALTTAIRLDASYSVSSQRYVRYQPNTTTDYSNKRVEQAPRDLANVLLGWAPSLLGGGRLAVEYNHTGRYQTDAANTHSYAGYDVIHLQANYLPRPSVEVFARITNVFDRNYAELVAFDPFQGSQYNPGSPRTAYLGVHYIWER